MLTPVISALRHYYNNTTGDVQEVVYYFILPVLDIKLLRHDTSPMRLMPRSRPRPGSGTAVPWISNRVFTPYK